MEGKSRCLSLLQKSNISNSENVSSAKRGKECSNVVITLLPYLQLPNFTAVQSPSAASEELHMLNYLCVFPLSVMPDAWTWVHHTHSFWCTSSIRQVKTQQFLVFLLWYLFKNKFLPKRDLKTPHLLWHQSWRKDWKWNEVVYWNRGRKTLDWVTFLRIFSMFLLCCQHYGTTLSKQTSKN